MVPWKDCVQHGSVLSLAIKELKAAKNKVGDLTSVEMELTAKMTARTARDLQEVGQELLIHHGVGSQSAFLCQMV